MVKSNGPRILLSNDDGVYAPGLAALERIARTISDDVWIVAPDSEQSGAAHSLSLSKPLRIKEVGDRRFAVDGTPTDCVMVGISKILKDNRPTLMLSGINHGSNLGEDVTYSGTVAAAMEATLLGVPAIALSQSLDGHHADFSVAEAYGSALIKRLLDMKWPAGVLLNINFPEGNPDTIQGVRVVKQGLRSIRDNIDKWHDPRGKPFYWIGANRDDSPTEEHTDLEAISKRYISLTPLHLDLTHTSTLEQLKLAFL